MSVWKCLIVSAVVGAFVAGSACTEKAADNAKETTNAAIDRTKEGANIVLEATQQTAEAGRDAAQKTKEIMTSSGEVINDGWVTTKLKAKFIAESTLKGSDIDVETRDRVVTLRGTVASMAGKRRAAAIARDTEGVARVVDQLDLK